MLFLKTDNSQSIINHMKNINTEVIAHMRFSLLLY